MLRKIKNLEDLNNNVDVLIKNIAADFKTVNDNDADFINDVAGRAVKILEKFKVNTYIMQQCYYQEILEPAYKDWAAESEMDPDDYDFDALLGDAALDELYECAGDSPFLMDCDGVDVVGKTVLKILKTGRSYYPNYYLRKINDNDFLDSVAKLYVLIYFKMAGVNKMGGSLKQYLVS